MSALPIGGEGGDTPRRGVPAENEAVPGGGASGVREETEPESAEFFGSWRCVFGVFEVVLKRVFKEKWTSSWASGSGCEGREREAGWFVQSSSCGAWWRSWVVVVVPRFLCFRGHVRGRGRADGTRTTPADQPGKFFFLFTGFLCVCVCV